MILVFGSGIWNGPGRCEAVIEDIRVNICSIRPGNSAFLNMHGAKQGRVTANRLEYWPSQVDIKIHFPMSAICKVDGDGVALSRFNVLYSY